MQKCVVIGCEQETDVLTKLFLYGERSKVVAVMEVPLCKKCLVKAGLATSGA